MWVNNQASLEHGNRKMLVRIHSWMFEELVMPAAALRGFMHLPTFSLDLVRKLVYCGYGHVSTGWEVHVASYSVKRDCLIVLVTSSDFHTITAGHFVPDYHSPYPSKWHRREEESYRLVAKAKQAPETVVCWKSIAVWPEDLDTGFATGEPVSEDTHKTFEAADGVRLLLRRLGYAGERKFFPECSYVEPVFLEEAKG
jgi:hypothetical protein